MLVCAAGPFLNYLIMKALLYIPFALLTVVSCKKDKDPVVDDTNDTTSDFADFTTNYKKSFGTSLEEDFAGSVIDNNGNIYIVGSSQPDGYAANVLVTKINLSNQQIVWSKSLDAGDQDFQPSPSENGHSNGGGGSRCIAIDASGDIYITGGSKQGFYEAFVTKMDANGNVLWQKFWEPGSSGLAKDNAKAYSLAVANNKVFVTGSTGASTSTENAYAFLLVLNSTDGTTHSSTVTGIDFSPTYNDVGYTVMTNDGENIFFAGWEGENNSGIVAKYTVSNETIDWVQKVNLGVGARFTDIDLDVSNNIYLAADYRGVSTFLGVVKLDANGSILWSKKYQGVNNDRNNVSCLRIINNNIYIGGRGSFEGYDESQWGDGSLVKFDLNGNLLKEYHFYTGNVIGERAGERIEGIHFYNNSIILTGETWPEGTIIEGNWYNAHGTLTSNSLTQTSITPSTINTDGTFSSTTFTVGNYGANIQDLSSGGIGSSDFILFSITE